GNHYRRWLVRLPDGAGGFFPDLAHHHHAQPAAGSLLRAARPARGDRVRAGHAERADGALGNLAYRARAVFALFWADGDGRFGLCVLCAFAALAALCPWIATQDPWANNTRPDGALARLDGPSAAHLLGTTYYGQDVFSQLVLSTPQTLLVGVVTAVLVGFIGTNVGLISGYFGGVVDDVLMRITDFFCAIPFLPFMMVVVSFLGTSVAVVIGSMSLV